MMRNMRALIVFIVMCAAAVQMAAAQPMRRTPEERTAQLKKQLDLTEKQEKQALEIFKEAENKRDEMFADMQGGGDRDAAREKMMKLFNETDTKIEKILTKEQKKKYEALKKERRQRTGNRGERKE